MIGGLWVDYETSIRQQCYPQVVRKFRRILVEIASDPDGYLSEAR
jgi:hypothetical protein